MAYNPTPEKIVQAGFTQEEHWFPVYEYRDLKKQVLWRMTQYEHGKEWSISSGNSCLFYGNFVSEEFFYQLLEAIGFPNLKKNGN